LHNLIRDEYVLEEANPEKSFYRVYDVLLGRWLQKLYQLNKKN
jgi:hypothetical protein